MKFVHAYSHSGIRGNDIADEMAKREVKLNVGKMVGKNNIKTVSEDVYNNIKANYKYVFKFLTVAEMIMLNNNLSGLNPDELFFAFKLQI